MPHRELVLTQLDQVRLNRALGARPDPAFAERIEAAEVVASRAIPPDVVTMNSRVRVVDTEGAEREVALVYPDQPVGADSVSVLSPLGRALLGARVGETLEAALPDGSVRGFTVRELAYQPEAAGDITR